MLRALEGFEPSDRGEPSPLALVRLPDGRVCWAVARDTVSLGVEHDIEDYPATLKVQRLHLYRNYLLLTLVVKRSTMRSMSAGRHT